MHHMDRRAHTKSSKNHIFHRLNINQEIMDPDLKVGLIHEIIDIKLIK